MLTIEPDGEKFHGACPDCGQAERSVWGYVSTEAKARAVYYVRWTDFHIERGAQIAVSIGTWGEAGRPIDNSALPFGSAASPGQARLVDRAMFGIECRISEAGPAFMLVDAESMPWEDAFLGMKLTRNQALCDARKPEVFEILDRIVVDDPRFRAFLEGRMRD